MASARNPYGPQMTYPTQSSYSESSHTESNWSSRSMPKMYQQNGITEQPSGVTQFLNQQNQPASYLPPYENINPGPILQDPIPVFSNANRSFGTTSTFTIGTLDEPVFQTVKRDILNIYGKLKVVLKPHWGTGSTSSSAYMLDNQDIGILSSSSASSKQLLREWDLWGPLLFCLILAISLSIIAPKEETANIFALIFALVWAGSGLITLNSRLLGGQISFFQNICIIGYCICPLAIASLLSIVCHWKVLRLLYLTLAFTWSCYASIQFLEDGHFDSKKGLMAYPLFLFYALIAWIILIS